MWRRTLAATVVTGVLLAGCGSDADDAGPEDPPVTSASTTTTRPSDTTAPGSSLDGTDSIEVVTEWISALADGDLDRAWELTHPESQEAFGGRAVFDDSASGFTEGYGAWASVEDRTETWVPREDGTGLVVLTGTLRQEGTTTEDATRAIPVRSSPDGPLVDAFRSPEAAADLS